MCSILVLRAMGSTSRVELAQTTRSLESSHSQPLGQNPRAVLDRSRSRVTLVRLFILLSCVLGSSCVHQGVKSVEGFSFPPINFLLYHSHPASRCEIWHWIHLLSLERIFTFSEYLHCCSESFRDASIDFISPTEQHPLFLHFNHSLSDNISASAFKSFICNWKCL